jgi:hypothetical protein
MYRGTGSYQISLELDIAVHEFFDHKNCAKLILKVLVTSQKRGERKLVSMEPY